MNLDRLRAGNRSILTLAVLLLLVGVVGLPAMMLWRCARANDHRVVSLQRGALPRSKGELSS